MTALLPALALIVVSCNSAVVKSEVETASSTPTGAKKVTGTTPGSPPTTAGSNPEWRRSGLAGVSLSVITADPRQPNTLYSGGKGVYKSLDQGKTWSTATTDFQADDIAVSPASASIIYAGATEGCYKGTEALSYRSDDGGKSWTAIGSNLRSYAPHPVNPDIVYAASCAGVVKSLDKGRNWQTLKTSVLPLGYDATHVAVAPGAPDVVYAMVVSEGGTVAMGKSNNAGATWAEVTPKGEAWAPMDLKIDSNDANIVYAVTGKGVFRTTDGGSSWKAEVTGLESVRKMDNAFVSYPVAALAIDPARSEVLYMATGGREPSGFGVFRSWDKGESWHDTGVGLGSMPVRDVTFAGDVMYAATSDGVWRLYW